MSGAASNVVFVAHQDDHILFMEQDLHAALMRGESITTVFVTAGDAGRGEEYWLEREAGARAAYSAMTGSAAWVTETVTFGSGDRSYQVVSSYLADHPEIRLYFLRAPDGMMQGGGSARYGRESLRQLVEGDIDAVHTVDGAASYSQAELVELMQLIMDGHDATNVMVQDHRSIFAHDDHSDHRSVAFLATLAHDGSDTDSTLHSYVDYGSRWLPANVPTALLEHFCEIFRAYTEHDAATQVGRAADGTMVFSAHFLAWLQRDYLVEEVLDIWSLDFNAGRSGWQVERHVRDMADVDGDGRADIIGFGERQVLTALADGLFFGDATGWASDYSFRTGWRTDRHERETGDLNGDGRADLIAFGDGGVHVALSDGTRFVDAGRWLADFGQNAGHWRVALHERAVADVDGDGRDDVIGFGGGSTLVSLSTGTGLTGVRVWTREFSYAAGWRNELHVRDLADVNGDGRADVVGFGDAGVRVALSTGTGFAASTLWTAEFGRDTGWSVALHERLLADVDGDGRADIVGFGEDGVLVALSTGAGFAAAQLWSDGFGHADGWRTDRHERRMADVNGDGRADIVGFGEDVVQVALSTGSGFAAPTLADEFLF
ncbi:FG-GAP-like repeat-containing protein [Paracoccus sp. TOH]|uniref:FG-GAP-like repeat-containing protein n=1 Tax=Paracoccus sp. TOH TaxID=1263728 RepID=UPI0025B1C0F3|nr:FG-GAP-like repeat-containing protein [Paracoccus sp. TOH]WJS85982.1 FG-GAP-like repeat-containing protein [Paracoccus sp. TOH]